MGSGHITYLNIWGQLN